MLQDMIVQDCCIGIFLYLSKYLWQHQQKEKKEGNKCSISKFICPPVSPHIKASVYNVKTIKMVFK